ncbi:2Fe-2S iron-sulfur cluster-binding protein [Pseudidiomarina taiwanensis]|uniref:(2Fe-2S)-binding protein n=1 Tax=Pseudidiomarina taiwanensis TaxID=337250 RepID=A0A432ZNT6_9GAMM|nr:2Fe-2S iron-sulfur cluster-binding protein [Pseudidiomarina taiwanensis]RUO79528.1 (2Fe-2S)-binding protein [Pseudidiomarina taiwanensis]
MPKVIYKDTHGGEYEVDVPVGENLMQAAVDNMIDGILGECGGVMSCATCHCYVDPAWVDKLPAAAEFEEDMLDMAIDPQENSRLSCQIEMTEALDGIVIHLPARQF